MHRFSTGKISALFLSRWENVFALTNSCNPIYRKNPTAVEVYTTVHTNVTAVTIASGSDSIVTAVYLTVLWRMAAVAQTAL